MTEYIERDSFLKLISHKPSCPTTDREDRLINGFISAVKNYPAAVVRHVVLCRDCKHWEKYDNTAGCGYCNKVKFKYGKISFVFKPVCEPDFFCADGEKREEA